ncbi:MAG: alpha/beta hydrolase [Solirubrobacteraceae bacterium]
MRRLAGAAGTLTLLLGGGALFATEALSVDQHRVRVIHFTIHSRFVGTHDEVVVVPPGTSGAGRPLLVFLHGKGDGRENSNLNASMFAALARQGARAPDIVFPDGGEDSYWHNRASGRWSSYVLDEVIPAAVRLLGADPRRLAIGGISMGGFGALDIARLHPGSFCAVGGHSAALWFAGADTAPGAFDDAQDFADHDVIAAARASNPYGPTPIWLDVGTDDPFRAADVALAAELRADHAEVALHVWPGGHDGSYWASHWSSYLAFYATALAGCHGS